MKLEFFRWSDGSVDLACPACGGAYLHHETVTSFNRDEDDKDTRVTAVSSTGFSEHILPSARVANPSLRRHGLSISFYCEECDGSGGAPLGVPSLELTVAQHKGSTHVSWRKIKA